MFRLPYFVAFFCALLVTCSDDPDSPMTPDPDEDTIVVAEAFPQLNFNRPVDIQNIGDDYFYVVEQPGVIKVFMNDPDINSADVFLDISSSVDNSDNEEGLLGLAFHPDYQQNGYFFLNYTTSQATSRISRFSVDPGNAFQADPNSELILLEFSQPFGNHNGGQLAFGSDGYLYIAVGDGGSGGDPQGHGQNTGTLLGSILRIDVDNTSNGLNYGIPSDNPFVGNQSGDREEIFAYGIRNPWRMSFDAVTGQLWVADVGQNEFEEIDIVENGGNYGWKIMEAAECYNSASCDQTGLIDPYYYYDHSQGDGSITGGYVYHGSMDLLKGKYIYADYISGRIWALDTSTPSNELLFSTSHRISTFGVDNQQELYFCSLAGKIYKLIAQ